jgi:hypothetical protein
VLGEIGTRDFRGNYKFMKYIIRLIALPFYAVVVLIAFIYKAITHLVLFVRFGGECIAYKKGEQKQIFDVWQELKKKNEAAN